VETGLQEEGRAVFVQGDAAPDVDPKYLFADKPNRWIISSAAPTSTQEHTILAYTSSDSMRPANIASEWRIKTAEGWEQEQIGVISANASHSALQRLWHVRTASKQGGPSRTLSNGLKMPMVGLGTGGIMNIKDVALKAINMGYGLLNTGENYGNNAEIGEALLAADVPRDQVWLMTKICPTNFGFYSTLNSIRASIEAFGDSKYIDTYLIHWPDCTTSEYQDCSAVEGRNATWRDSWYALERAYAEGTVMSIGVSNWEPKLFDELLGLSVVAPHVVEQRMNPLEQEWGMIDTAKAHNAFYFAYGSLRNIYDDYFRRELMDPHERTSHDVVHRRVKMVADKVGRKPVHVVLRWQVQQGFGVMPRATKDANLKSNLEDVFGFELDPNDIDLLNVRSFEQENLMAEAAPEDYAEEDSKEFDMETDSEAQDQDFDMETDAEDSDDGPGQGDAPAIYTTHAKYGEVAHAKYGEVAPEDEL